MICYLSVSVYPSTLNAWPDILFPASEHKKRIILLTSSICVRKGSHLAVDYLGPSLAPAARKALGVLTGVLIVAYSAVVFIWGVRLMIVGAMQVSPAMQINMAVVYAVFPLAGVLLVVEGTLATLRQLKAGAE